ncbi:hypothetical protein ENKNEFLB_00154 [Nocardioides aquaticus]|uniref:DUF2017 domain-containing protein n=2 Tax=Actinomycetes TaxID=1760 RepID=A0ABX8ED69_9ACTN|nr:hypothetical protein [Nocardioides aquaticus]QVT77785.1 hypothetical protein ENKNEFLB_00154 [Nocardioides aquaticus]
MTTALACLVDILGNPLETPGVSLPTPHPAFVLHFNDPIYDDTGLETAPFGSDEGSDVLQDWGQRRDELGRNSTIADVLETDQAGLDALVGTFKGIDYLDQAALIRGAAFTLLRLTGHLSVDDRALALRTIEYETQTTADPGWLPQEVREQMLPALHVQREDLLSWANPGE